MDNGYTNGKNGNSKLDVDVANPYVTSQSKTDGDNAKTKTDYEFPKSLHAASALPNSPELSSNPRKKKGLRIFGALSVVIFLSALGIYFFYPNSKEIEYQIVDGKKKKKPDTQTQSATGAEQSVTNQTTLEAIKQAQESLRQGGALPETSSSPGATNDTNKQTEVGATVFTPYVVPDYPATPFTKGPGGAITPDDGNGDSGSAGAGGATRTATSNRYSGSSNAVSRSIYVKRESEKNIQPVKGNISKSFGPVRTDAVSIPVPPFGTRLPVRARGAIFTLRDGSLAQFELPMDVKGPGWNLKRGTILVAKTNGSVNDRAFLNLVGFIDPITNRLVRLAGEVQGGDGAVGLKGKRRRLNSRLASVLNRVANGGLALGQAALNRGGTTIVMGNGLGSDFGLSPAAISRREFVEISAGTPAYVIINDLPIETKSIDSDPSRFLSEMEIISDDELADLLEKGDVNEIKAAMPRLSPDMKKLAKMLIGEK